MKIIFLSPVQALSITVFFRLLLIEAEIVHIFSPCVEPKLRTVQTSILHVQKLDSWMKRKKIDLKVNTENDQKDVN